MTVVLIEHSIPLSLLIDDDGPAVSVAEPQPVMVIQTSEGGRGDRGLQGVQGPPGQSADENSSFDPGDLTLIFDNGLLEGPT